MIDETTMDALATYPEPGDVFADVDDDKMQNTMTMRLKITPASILVCVFRAVIW